MTARAYRRTASSKRYLAIVAAAAVFIWLSSRSLPPVVASHFGASGAADGFMHRRAYTWFMIILVVAVPCLLVLLPNRVISYPGARINLPNRSYWLAPERRAETVEYLRATSRRFGCLMAGFLAYVHWLVVEANATIPPVLRNDWFVGGLVVMVLAVVVTVVGISRRFGRTPG